MTLLASSNDSTIHSLTNAEANGVGDNKTSEVADLNDTRNDDQQAIVVKQEENQRSSTDTKNKVIASSLANGDSDNKGPEEAEHSNSMVVILKPDALSQKDVITRKVESEGFLITQQREIQLTTNEASNLFKEDSNEITESMTRGPMFAMVLQKNSADVIQDWQRLMGHRHSDVNTNDETNMLYHSVVRSSQSFEQAKKDVELLFHDSCVTQHENNASDRIDQQQQHEDTTQSQPLFADVNESIQEGNADTVSPSTDHITTRNAADPKVSKEEEEEEKDIVVNASPCSSTDKLQEGQAEAILESAADEIVTQYNASHKNAVTCDEKKDDQTIMADSLDENKVAPPQDADLQVSKNTATHPPSITEHKEQSKTQSKSKQQPPLSNDEPNINIPSAAQKRAKMPRVALLNPKPVSQPDKVPLPIAKKKTSSTKSRLARLTAPTISSSRKHVAAYEMGSIDTKTGSQTATIAIKAARSRILSPRK